MVITKHTKVWEWERMYLIQPYIYVYFEMNKKWLNHTGLRNIEESWLKDGRFQGQKNEKTTKEKNKRLLSGRTTKNKKIKCWTWTLVFVEKHKRIPWPNNVYVRCVSGPQHSFGLTSKCWIFNHSFQLSIDFFSKNVFDRTLQFKRVRLWSFHEHVGLNNFL